MRCRGACRYLRVFASQYISTRSKSERMGRARNYCRTERHTSPRLCLQSYALRNSLRWSGLGLMIGGDYERIQLANRSCDKSGSCFGCSYSQWRQKIASCSMSSEQKGHFLLSWLEARSVLGCSLARLADIPLPIPATTRPGNTKSSTLNVGPIRTESLGLGSSTACRLNSQRQWRYL